jgi:hypothetical protein
MARRSASGYLQDLVDLFRALNLEQRVAAVGAVLLVVSTFGPFSFVEAAEILTGLGVLALLRARAQGRAFHLPLGDGTAIAAAGVWAALLIIARLFDRPLGQNLLALACAAILVAAGVRERAKRPADDLAREPVGRDERRPRGEREPRDGREPRTRRLARPAPGTPGRAKPAETLSVPEFIPPGREPKKEETSPAEPSEAPTVVEGGEQLTLADEEDPPASDRPADP